MKEIFVKKTMRTMATVEVWKLTKGIPSSEDKMEGCVNDNEAYGIWWIINKESNAQVFLWRRMMVLRTGPKQRANRRSSLIYIYFLDQYFFPVKYYYTRYSLETYTNGYYIFEEIFLRGRQCTQKRVSSQRDGDSDEESERRKPRETKPRSCVHW